MRSSKILSFVASVAGNWPTMARPVLDKVTWLLCWGDSSSLGVFYFKGVFSSYLVQKCIVARLDSQGTFHQHVNMFHSNGIHLVSLDFSNMFQSFFLGSSLDLKHVG